MATWLDHVLPANWPTQDNMVVFCFGINLGQVPSWVFYDTDWIGWDTQSQVVPQLAIEI